MSGISLDILPDADYQVIQQRLDALEQELQTRALRAGLREAGRPLMQLAAQLAPRDDGDLAQGMSMSILDRRRAKTLSLRVGASGGLDIDNPGQLLLVGPNRKVRMRHQGFKGALMEFGSTAGYRKGRRVRVHGQRRRRRGLSYYSRGVTAQPYLEPAYQQVSGQFDTLFYNGLERYLDRIDRRRARSQS